MTGDVASEGWDAKPPSAAEQDIVHAARNGHERCVCGEVHQDEDWVSPAVIGRMKAYLAANPGHEFVVDEEAGLVAIVIVSPPGHSGPVQVLACGGDLREPLD